MIDFKKSEHFSEWYGINVWKTPEGYMFTRQKPQDEIGLLTNNSCDNAYHHKVDKPIDCIRSLVDLVVSSERKDMRVDHYQTAVTRIASRIYSDIKSQDPLLKQFSLAS